jgi:hypothetical protein
MPAGKASLDSSQLGLSEVQSRPQVLEQRKTTLIAAYGRCRILRAGNCGHAGGKEMQWWAKGLILSIIWLGIVIAVGYIHTEVFLAGAITQAQDEAISETYGIAAGIGLVVLWMICFFRLRRASA